MADHEQVNLTVGPNQIEIEVDIQLATLITLLWATGHATSYSCQGNPTSPDRWNSQTQGYISFPSTLENRELTVRLFHEFDLFTSGDMGKFVLEFEDHSTFGRRIVWRFPNHIIPAIADFVADQYDRQELGNG